MALRHKPTGAVGVQFHPESILTPDRRAMLANFLAPVSDDGATRSVINPCKLNYPHVGRIDPFYAYLDLTEQSSARGQAFLLDAAKDAPSMYRMSVIGVLPVLQVSAKDGEDALTCSVGLMRYLRERCSLLTARDTFIEREQATVRILRERSDVSAGATAPSASST